MVHQCRHLFSPGPEAKALERLEKKVAAYLGGSRRRPLGGMPSLVGFLSRSWRWQGLGLCPRL
eukprot:11411226-Prorocentrum_lima.AAC.1